MPFFCALRDNPNETPIMCKRSSRSFPSARAIENRCCVFKWQGESLFEDRGMEVPRGRYLRTPTHHNIEDRRRDRTGQWVTILWFPCAAGFSTAVRTHERLMRSAPRTNLRAITLGESRHKSLHWVIRFVQTSGRGKGTGIDSGAAGVRARGSVLRRWSGAMS